MFIFYKIYEEVTKIVFLTETVYVFLCQSILAAYWCWLTSYLVLYRQTILSVWVSVCLALNYIDVAEVYQTSIEAVL